MKEYNKTEFLYLFQKTFFMDMKDIIRFLGLEKTMEVIETIPFPRYRSQLRKEFYQTVRM